MKTIKTAVVGIGKLGTAHAENLARRVIGAELIAVCSRRKENNEKFKEKIPVPYSYENYDALLENKEIEAVCLTSYTKFHPEHILKALRAGKHVFCEKPVAESYEASQAVVEEIKKHHQDKVVMMAYMRRFDPSYQYVKEQIDEGKLGTPVLIRSYSADWRKITEEDLGDFKNRASIFHDFLVHDFDLSRWLLGSDWADETLSVLGGVYHFDFLKELGHYDNASCMARFKNRAMAYYYCGRTAPHGYFIETEVIGTEAVFKVGTAPGRDLVEVLDHRGNVRREHEMFLNRFEKAYLNEMQHFVDCIRYERAPSVRLDDALEATRMADLATRKDAEQREQK